MKKDINQFKFGRDYRLEVTKSGFTLWRKDIAYGRVVEHWIIDGSEFVKDKTIRLADKSQYPHEFRLLQTIETWTEYVVRKLKIQK